MLTYVYKHGGVFPVRRGHHDEEAFKTAFTLLEQGEMLLVYAEGGRSRSGELRPARNPASAGMRSNRARRSCRSRSTARPRCGAGRRFTFPKVTVQFGEPLSFPVEAGPDRERQLEVATEVFDRVREMYAGLAGRASFTSTQRGVRKTLSAPLTFRAPWVGESRANGQHR